MNATLKDAARVSALENETGPFAGPGEMRRRCREFDWSNSPIGPIAEWPHSLRAIVTTMMASRHPMFLWWGPDLIQIFNDGYLPSFGTTGRDRAALGARGREHWREIWPIIGPQIESVLTTAEATWHEDQLVPIERNGRLEDVWWTYGYSPVRDDDGAVAGVLVVVQETTSRVKAIAERETLLVAERASRAEAERLRAEAEVARQRLDELFRQAPAFIAVVRGADLVFELANDAYYQLVGRRDIIGKPLFDAVPDARGQGFEELLRSVLDTGKPVLGYERPIKLARTAGELPEERFVNFVYAPLVENDGSRSGVFVHGVDVTETVSIRQATDVLNQELAARTAEAEEARLAAETANRTKSEFLAVMSHELRTPLNAIAGYADLIELGVHGPVTADQITALARIKQSQRHLLGLINGVLTYSRIEAGAIEYVVADVVVDDVIASCEALITPQASAKGLHLASECDRGLVARADRDKVQQILINLLSNAVKFTPPGGSIFLDCSTAPAGEIAMRVIDTGRGISADQLERVFQPFVQIDTTLTRTNEGTGLGLAISRDLARGMGGDVIAESTPGLGSVFTLLLPPLSAAE